MLDYIITTNLDLNLINNYSNFLDFLGMKVLYSWQLFAQQLDVDL